jgi:hypothetical protein
VKGLVEPELRPVRHGAEVSAVLPPSKAPKAVPARLALVSTSRLIGALEGDLDAGSSRRRNSVALEPDGSSAGQLSPPRCPSRARGSWVKPAKMNLFRISCLAGDSGGAMAGVVSGAVQRDSTRRR